MSTNVFMFTPPWSIGIGMRPWGGLGMRPQRGLRMKLWMVIKAFSYAIEKCLNNILSYGNETEKLEVIF